MAIRVLIVDDYEPVRRGMRLLLSRRADWLVCGEAADGLEGVEMARRLRPDVILMDISMPRMNGIEATRIIRQEAPESAVIIVSQNDPALMGHRAAEVKAQAYLGKADLARNLIPAIQKIMDAHTASLTGRANGDSVHSSSIREMAQYFPGDSEMAGRMRAFDWSATDVGAPDSWPENLRVAVRICLTSRFPIVIWWGRTYTTFYNDGYRSFLGNAKHPQWLGRSGKECWREIWHIMGPMWEKVFATGEATWSEDFLYVLNRNLPQEEGYFTFSYSPILNDQGNVNGIFCACYETTDQVVGARRLETLRKLASQGLKAHTVGAGCNAAAKVLAQNPYDIPFTAIYLMNDEEKEAALKSFCGLPRSAQPLPLSISIQENNISPWPFASVLRTLAPADTSDLLQAGLELPGGPWPESASKAVVLPIPGAQYGSISGLAVFGVSPRRPLDNAYRTFFNLIAGHIGTAISNAKAYEAEQKRAEALAEIDRAKTLFFSNVSHEFRTPLTLMLGPLEDALAARDGLAAEQRERLEVAHRNSLRLLKLVNTLLDFSRIEAGRIEACYEPTDLASFTAELASVFQSAVERAGLLLLIICPQISEPVYVDREMWEKIVFNLLSNAFKFTFTGEIEVLLREVNGGVELVVKDTGTGIPAQELPHLFERFYRVKGARGRTLEGSGIGLALIQELAKLHGGSARAESEVDRGSAFTVTIPLGKDHLPADRVSAERSLASTGVSGEAYVQEVLRWLPGDHTTSDEFQGAPLLSALEPLSPSGCPPEQSARILLADDNRDMREYVERLLRDQYEVAAVADGKAALKAARARRPDVILSDIMMPRMDGFALLEAIRADEALRNIPVILLSARAGEESRVEGLNAGADDYLVKPFSARELLARVRSHLVMARVQREAAERERNLRAETEKRERQFREMIDALPAAIYTTDAEGRLTHFNPAAVELSGRVPELGTDRWCVSWKMFRPDGAPLPHDECPMAVALKEGRVIEGAEAILERPDGTRRWFMPYPKPLLDEQGKVIGGINMLLDITERKEAERTTALLAAIVDSSDDAIVSKNLDGIIMTWNKAAERIFGYKPEEAIGQEINLIIPPDRQEEEKEILARIRRGEPIDHFETIRKRKDGSPFDISVTISPVRDATGRVIGASKVGRDITERKRASEALRESETRFRALSEKLDSEVQARTRELEEKNRDVLQQAEQLRELSWRLLRMQDEERRRIARELHDSAGQTLAVLGMNLASLVESAKQKAPDLAQAAEETQELVQQLTKEIRTMSYLLHPPLLDENGLPAALSWYIRGLTERSGLDITFNISEEFGRLPREMELVVFRLIQECLTNIHRHSGAQSASIQVVRESDRVLIEVRDQGRASRLKDWLKFKRKGREWESEECASACGNSTAR